MLLLTFYSPRLTKPRYRCFVDLQMASKMMQCFTMGLNRIRRPDPQYTSTTKA